ncbi:uncharacterized protein LOC131172111 [Hevea brasiliensis]|uniref:uncharacterized protein LOC131172111 n=1 Tax=Hevea brasiliensis TaxID=3981 RepID=UPI0025E09F0F|nr:uncharacterized protein LOC131172111 [Hevea brasiliensis]
MYGSVDMSSLRLVPDVVVPLKFKVPEFDKYNRSSDPRIHLATYIAKMSALTEDDILLVHFFHESLTGAALRWCIQLDRSRLRSWKDLADTFLKQYKFNCDVTPTQRDLQNLVLREKESFKEYAQRWREKAAEVYPPVTDNELCSLFIETLKALYFNLMIGNTSNSFSDIIQTGERIEANLRLERLQEVVGESYVKKSTNFGKKKEGDVHSISKQTHLPSQNNFCSPPDQTAPFGSPTPQPGPRPSRNPDPSLPLPLSEIYRYLLDINQIVSIPLDPIQPPYPRWYDPSARCEYHGGAVGHSTDNCGALRGRLIPYFDEILTMTVLEGYIHPHGLDSENDRSGSGCPYHDGAADHKLQNCDEFKEKIQKIISLKILRCQLKSKEEKEVNTAIYGEDISRSAPKIVFSVPTTSTPPSPTLTVIRTPPQLPVTNTHAVPWNYNFQVFTQSASSSTSTPLLNHTYTQPITTLKPCFTPHAHFKMTYTAPSNDSALQFTSKSTLANDSPLPDQEVEFIIRSGRCYSTDEKKSKGKVEAGESPV